MRKLLFLLLLTVAFGVQAFAQATLVADAPDAVVSGDQFRLSFTVNTQNVKDFRAPSIKGFDVLMGPSRSQQSSMQIINGKTTSSSSITYTYILMATDAGNYTIPAASIEADGKKIFSNALTIKVLPPDKAASANSNGQRSSSGARNQSSAGHVSGNELFITASASKTTVHEQEAVLLTYKVYTQVNLTGLLGKIGDLKGFQIQELEVPNSRKTWQLEHYKGRNYSVATWAQYILFPQQTGKLEVPAITFEAEITQPVAVDDPFDAFFNGTSIREIKKNIIAPKLSINVQPLPSKPANFSGGVGDFTLSSSINSKEVRTNDAVTVKLTIKGSGNMKLINAPEVKFPEDFEVYDPKTTNNFKASNAGLTGTQTIEYLAIPRSAGTFTIPPVEFVYFDLKSNSYKTLKTEAYELKVAKGKGNADQVIANFTNKEDVKMLGEDIRFIKLGETSFSPKGNYFFGTTPYYLWYIIPLILFVALVVFFRKQAAENANIVKVKTKKANKVATKRMKLAGKLLSENKKNEFYDEVLKALWGYTSDKLSIPVSQLSKDNIESELVKYGVPQDVITNFMGALNECEFARYAPGDENEAMDKVYSMSVEAISRMENCIKH